MSGGIRPKGSKSYAATRSPEAAEAFRQDQAAQRALGSVEGGVCPKCDGKMRRCSRGGATVYRDADTFYWECQCGHEEKVNTPPTVVGFERPDGTKVVADFGSSITDFINRRLEETKSKKVKP